MVVLVILVFNKMKYLALDNALVTTGWSVFFDSSLVECGHFTISASKSIEKRLGEYWEQLTNLYNEYEFDYLFFEDCQSQGNAQTYHKLSMVKATILLWCYFNKINYHIMSPSNWRSVLSSKYGLKFGKSRAEQKNNAKGLVKRVYQIEPTEDECDAICIGLAGIAERTQPKSAF